MKLHIASSNHLIKGTSTESSGRYCIATMQHDLINANCFAGMQPFKSCATAAEADGLRRCPRGKEQRSFLNGCRYLPWWFFCFVFFRRRLRLRFWVTCMRERTKSKWGVFDLQPPLLSVEPPGGVQRKPSTSSTRGVRKCKYTWDPPAWHRSRTLRVHLCSTFFARIGQLGLWKVLSHERHQPTPPPVQYFPSKFEFLWGRKGATNYLLFTAIPLYQWTFAWPHEKRLPPQSSGFSAPPSTVRTSAACLSLWGF